MRVLRISPWALAGLLALTAGASAAGKKEAVLVGGNHEVRVERDIPYGPDKDTEPRRKLDLYLPKGEKGFPVLFYVHGGGWTRGDKRTFARQGRLFAKNGIGVVTINYRLSPKVKHPEHIKDVARAFAWTHKNIARYGGDPDQLFVSGHSAGGHLVALLATDESYLKAEGLSLKAIRGAIPISGVYVILPVGRLSEVFGDAATGRQASPGAHAKGKKPPFLIFVADKDISRFEDMARGFCKALTDGKNAAECITVAGRTHGTIMMRIANEDDPVTQGMLRFLAKHSTLELRPSE
jgi:acetyl esterase/lipase